MNVPQRQMTWDEVVAQMVVYRNERDALRAENERLKSSIESYITLANTAYEITEQRTAELEAARKDAQQWRDYKARKDAAIAAGLGRNPLREEPTK